MEKSTIGRLFLSDLSDENKMTASEHEILGKMSDAYDELTEALEINQKELLEKFIKERENLSFEENERFYSIGFKLGLRIGIECMVD